jgi:hypothetical protein
LPVVKLCVWQKDAPDGIEHVLAAGDRRRSARRVGRWCGRREQAHEEGELLDGAQRVDGPLGIGIRDAVGVTRDQAIRRLVALVLKQLVADAHFDVVGLAREEEQRLVLRLPAKPGDGAVVAVAVRLSADGSPVDDEVRPAADA